MKRIYDTDRWHRLRRLHLFKHPLCFCGKPAHDIDHRVPVKAGGDPWEPGNIESLCYSHFVLQTSGEPVERPGETNKRWVPRPVKKSWADWWE